MSARRRLKRLLLAVWRPVGGLIDGIAELSLRCWRGPHAIAVVVMVIGCRLSLLGPVPKHAEWKVGQSDAAEDED